jgi:subfamily B ATP-binding cassette protein MsbA
VRPRAGLLGIGFVLMVINRVCGLVLPGSTKFLIDNILRQGQANKLPLLVGIVFSATAVQAVTSFSLTQLLSKAAQRLITDLRKQVQQHVGRLSVSFYDANRTGVLVSRIMTDVEGVRNLIGTGLVDFAGGILTALLAFVILLHTSRTITLIVFAVLAVFVFILQRAFKTIRPIFRERAKINDEVTGRLTESLGGVRVVRGYHTADPAAGVFNRGAAASGQCHEVADGDQRAFVYCDDGVGRGRRPGDVPGRAPGIGAPSYDRRVRAVHHVPGVHGGAGVSSGERGNAADRSGCRAGPYHGDSE